MWSTIDVREQLFSGKGGGGGGAEASWPNIFYSGGGREWYLEPTEKSHYTGRYIYAIIIVMLTDTTDKQKKKVAALNSAALA